MKPRGRYLTLVPSSGPGLPVTQPEASAKLFRTAPVLRLAVENLTLAEKFKRMTPEQIWQLAEDLL